ncbi:MAG TPA: peptide deformylase [Acidimicrobiales bacterium]|nr:peptide deformylase [Acidimicrobiales bacterium]
MSGVRQFPDPVLATVCEPVGGVDVALGESLLDAMRTASHSVGVAAPQIGISKRAFCIDVTGHKKANTCHGELVVFDPVVVLVEGGEVGREGCMSVPDLTGDVRRATRIVVTGIGLDGAAVEIDADAFEARAVQHELDHLDGLLFLDRVVAKDRVFRRRTYR